MVTHVAQRGFEGKYVVARVLGKRPPPITCHQNNSKIESVFTEFPIVHAGTAARSKNLLHRKKLMFDSL